jgi:hypothetical protein
MRISSSTSSSSSTTSSRILFFLVTAFLVAFQIFAFNILVADAQDATSTNDTTIVEVGTDDDEEEDPTWKSLLKSCKHQTRIYTVVNTRDNSFSIFFLFYFSELFCCFSVFVKQTNPI